MNSVTVGGPGLVAVGTNRSIGHLAVVWTSSDGITWSRVPHDEAVFGGTDRSDRDGLWMMSVTAGGSGLVAVGASGEGDAYADGMGAGFASDDLDAAVWKWGD